MITNMADIVQHLYLYHYITRINSGFNSTRERECLLTEYESCFEALNWLNAQYISQLVPMKQTLHENEFLNCPGLQFVVSVAFEEFLTDLFTLLVFSNSTKHCSLIILLVLLLTKTTSGYIVGTKPWTTFYFTEMLWLVLLNIRDVSV